MVRCMHVHMHIGFETKKRNSLGAASVSGGETGRVCAVCACRLSDPWLLSAPRASRPLASRSLASDRIIIPRMAGRLLLGLTLVIVSGAASVRYHSLDFVCS